MTRALRLISLDGWPRFHPGDPRPEGYLEWMDWAEVQHKAGMGQVRCRACHLYQFPQELAVREDAAGGPLCRSCAALAAYDAPA